MTWLVSVHRFLSRQLVYTVLLSSVLALGAWLGRGVIDGVWAYRLLPWNLLLAWIPYLSGLAVTLLNLHWPGKWWLLPVPFAFWLVFFPNAPYLITDLSHLFTEPGAPAWYDIILFSTFVWTGCLIAVVSLRSMQGIVRQYAGSPASWLFVGTVLLLTGLAIYLGHFLRLNSWDIVLEPHRVLVQVGQQIVHPIQNIRTYGVTLAFASFLFVCYLTFVSVERRERF